MTKVDTTLPGRLHKIAVDAAHLEIGVLHKQIDPPQLEHLLRDLQGQVLDVLLMNARPAPVALATTEAPPSLTRRAVRCTWCQTWFPPQGIGSHRRACPARPPNVTVNDDGFLEGGRYGDVKCPLCGQKCVGGSGLAAHRRHKHGPRLMLRQRLEQ